jgi:hypothetical protein
MGHNGEQMLIPEILAVATRPVPLMDWTGTSQKAKYNQFLNAVSIGCAVPNAVLIWF